MEAAQLLLLLLVARLDSLLARRRAAGRIAGMRRNRGGGRLLGSNYQLATWIVVGRRQLLARRGSVQAASSDRPEGGVAGVGTKVVG